MEANRTHFVQPGKIEIDANERAVTEKSQCCFFVCTIFDSFLNDLQRWLTNKNDWIQLCVFIYKMYIAVFFITGRTLRGSALFLFPDQKTTCWKRTRKTRKDVVTYHYRNRSWILCYQNSPCVFPDRTDRVWLRAVYHAECPAVQWEILCVRNWAADTGEK